MSRIILPKYINPIRLLNAVRQRGIKGAALHALRRAGTLSQRALVGPNSLSVNPMSYVCNHACPMCWLHYLSPEELKHGKEKDLEEGMRLGDYMTLLAGMPPGLEEVNLVGGGEPLLHPEAVEIMRAIKRHRLKGLLITNGTLMNEPVSKALIDIRWDAVRVSVNAGDAETYRLVQGVDRFDTLVSNMKTFVRLRRDASAEAQCCLIILHIIQRENFPTIDKLFAFAEEIGADALEFGPVIPYSPHFELSPDELRQAGDTLTACARDSHIPCNITVVLPKLQAEETSARENTPFRPANKCSVGFDQAFITSVGDVLPCCYSDQNMGNVREQTFRDIWFSENYADFRKRLIQGKFTHYCISNRCSLTEVLHD